MKRSEGLTQAQLAERLGVAQGTVANWMSGRRSPSDLDEFTKIAGALNVDVTWLMHGTEQQRVETVDKSSLIPILNPDQVTGWCKNSKKVNTSSNKFVSAPRTSKLDISNFYAIEATDSGMEPTICTGDIIIINPADNPTPGKLIALDFHGTGHLTIGKLATKGSSWRLNLSDEFIELDKEYANIYRGIVISILFSPEIH